MIFPQWIGLPFKKQGAREAIQSGRGQRRHVFATRHDGNITLEARSQGAIIDTAVQGCGLLHARTVIQMNSPTELG